jgi:membrane AbrB-like protein
LHEPRPPSPPLSAILARNWRRILETLAIAGCGAFLLARTGLPAAYLTGAMIAVAAASLAGRPLFLPSAFAHITSVTLGMALGSAISPAMLHGFGAYPLSLMVLLVSTGVVVGCSTLYLRIVHRWDSISALLASAPGAVSQMTLLAVETKSDAVGVSIVQMLRVILLVVLLPVLLGLAGYSIGNGGIGLAAVTASPSALALVVPAAIISGYAFFRMRFPGGWLFGAMFASGLLHGFGIVEGGLPQMVTNLATVGIGAMAGARFAGLRLQTLLRHFVAGVGTFVIALAVVAVFMFIDVRFAGARPQEAAMSFAPGAMDVMMAVSLTMHLDFLFVSGHHLLRFFAVSLVMPFLLRAAVPKREELPESEV